jgi:hypothetical protein
MAAHGMYFGLMQAPLDPGGGAPPAAPAPPPPILEVAVGNGIFNLYTQFLEDKGITRRDYHYQHPGLNMRYGIEIEFFSSSNRFTLASRVNSCMFNQNFPGFWRKNYDTQASDVHDINQRLGNPNKPIKYDEGFDQYSSFFLEAQQKYGGPSFKGLAKCDRKGVGGFRIENDSSVTNDIVNYNGMTIWSLNAHQRNTDIKYEDVDGVNRFGDNFRGLRETNTDYFGDTPDTTSSEYTRRAGATWEVDNEPQSEYSVKFSTENELVSPILTNRNVWYPDFMRDNLADHDFDDTAEEAVANMKLLPVGCLAIDNLMNHMKAHTSVLGVNGCGLHVHLSEFPMIPNNLDGSISDHRKQVLVGFIKMFWLFEPLLYSFHPHYRASSTWAQNLQSLFTFDELIWNGGAAGGGNWEYIWNDLNRNLHYHAIQTPFGGIQRMNRKIKGTATSFRYVAVNTLNIDCVDAHAYAYAPGRGIRTIEVRIGHGTFSSEFIQSWVHILQQIFSLSQCLVEKARVDGQANPCYYVDQIIIKAEQKGAVPYYTKQTQDQYSNRVADRGKITEANYGRPAPGFFINMGNTAADRSAKSNILKKLIQLYYTCTGSEGALQNLFKYTLYYHVDSSSWINIRQLEPFDVSDVFTYVNTAYGRATVHGRPDKITNRINSYRSVFHGRDYLINKNKGDFQNRCKTCAKDGVGAGSHCKADFADGNTPQQVYSDRERRHLPDYTLEQQREDYRLEGRLFKTQCPAGGRKHYGKTQTELIPFKTTYSSAHEYLYGGRRTTKAKTQSHPRMTTTLNKQVSKTHRGYRCKDKNRCEDKSTKEDYVKMYNDEDDTTYINPIKNKIEFKDDKKPWPPKMIYRIREGLDNIIVEKQKSGSLVAFHTNWLQEMFPLPSLSKILNTLISRKILTEKEIMMLADQKYIDPAVFCTTTEEHLAALKEEVGKKFGFSDSKLKQIQSVYKEFENLPAYIYYGDLKKKSTQQRTHTKKRKTVHRKTKTHRATTHRKTLMRKTGASKTSPRQTAKSFEV